MYDYPDQIKELIRKFFSPSEPLFSDLKLSTKEMLSFLFRTFPADCISEYDLSDILLELGYKPQVYVVNKVVGEGDKAKDVPTLETGWCFKSYYDIKP